MDDTLPNLDVLILLPSPQRPIAAGGCFQNVADRLDERVDAHMGVVYLDGVSGSVSEGDCPREMMLATAIGRAIANKEYVDHPRALPIPLWETL